MALKFPKPKRTKRRKKHSKSIMHYKDGTCYICMNRYGNTAKHAVLHEHHVFGGPNRALAEEDGLTVYLCVEHHQTGKDAVHNGAEGKENREFLHREAQKAYERTHSRQEFMARYLRNYL